MDNFSDSFDYMLQLTKTLSTQCWNNRHETQNIEQLLLRLSKQTNMPYNTLIEEPSQECREEYEEMAKPSEEEDLIMSNYKLVYLIEQQEYLNNKLWTLIAQINELIVSIRDFIIEQKSIRPKIECEFIEKNVIEKSELLESNQELLKECKSNSFRALETVLNRLQAVCKEIEWDKIPREDKRFRKLLDAVRSFEEKHEIKLINAI